MLLMMGGLGNAGDVKMFMYDERGVFGMICRAW